MRIADWRIKKVILFIIFLCGCFAVNAQYPQKYQRYNYRRDPNWGKLKKVYMDSTWNRSTLTLYGEAQTIPNTYIRYDLLWNVIELHDSTDVRELDPKFVKSFVMYKLFHAPQHFINARDFIYNGKEPNFLMEVLAEGKLSLYKQYFFWIKGSNENRVLGIARTDDIAIMQNQLYYAHDLDLFKLPNKKKLTAIFGDKAAAVGNFIKENELEASSESDLVRIFTFYNSL